MWRQGFFFPLLTPAAGAAGSAGDVETRQDGRTDGRESEKLLEQIKNILARGAEKTTRGNTKKETVGKSAEPHHTRAASRP